MIKKRISIAYNNSGETLVEIMVAFIVLMIVIAIFTGAISAAGSSLNQSIDSRRTTDDNYKALHTALEAESVRGAGCDASVTPKTATINSADNRTGADISITAYRYTEGDTVYWVYR